LLRRNIMRLIMTDRIDRSERQISGWPGVVSAWTLLLLFLLLLAGVGAVACPRGGPQPHRHLAGVVIPQHDPCIGPGVASASGVDGCQIIPLNQDRSAYW
jgi:hypothetical protein